jgi:hypothetical protein
MPYKDDYKIRKTVKIRRVLADKARQVAADHDLSLTEFLETALEVAIEKQK